MALDASRDDLSTKLSTWGIETREVVTMTPDVRKVTPGPALFWRLATARHN